jgi:hypothetical protein
MKKLIAILTLVIGSAGILPTEAQASPYRYRHYDGDNVEYRRVRRLVGYTRSGYPIYRWRTIVVYHRDRDRDYGYGNGYYQRRYRRY